MVNLDGPGGFSYYWHDIKKNNAPRMSRNFGGGSLMFWDTFSYAGKLQLSTVYSKMNAKIYTDILEDELLPYLDRNDEFTF